MAVLALDVKIQPGLQVQLAALGLLAQPLAIIAQVFKLPAQTLGQRRQARRKGCASLPRGKYICRLTKFWCRDCLR